MCGSKWRISWRFKSIRGRGRFCEYSAEDRAEIEPPQLSKKNNEFMFIRELREQVLWLNRALYGKLIHIDRAKKE